MFVFASAETYVHWTIPLNVRRQNCPPSKLEMDAKAITTGRKVNHCDASSLWSGCSTSIVKKRMQKGSSFNKCWVKNLRTNEKVFLSTKNWGLSSISVDSLHCFFWKANFQSLAQTLLVAFSCTICSFIWFLFHMAVFLQLSASFKAAEPGSPIPMHSAKLICFS